MVSFVKKLPDISFPPSDDIVISINNNIYYIDFHAIKSLLVKQTIIIILYSSISKTATLKQNKMYGYAFI